jgi:2-polyprenyl-3-methyl-5-hydroxy-6-metoxy-1,4-benzoquinol methylase
MDLKEQDLLGGDPARHWYYVAKGRALRALLAGRTVPEVLDVGAGSGVFARQLLDAGVCASAVCVDPNYPEERVEPRAGKEIQFRRAVAQVSQPLILMIDVLEHVADDCGLLRSYAERAAAGTLVLISVPAFQCLWSGHDVFLGHHRRYTRTQLEALVRRAGLEVVRTRYFFAALLPLIALLRLYDRWRLRRGRVAARSALGRQHPLANALLIWLHGLERRVLFRHNRIAGLSVLCLARRRGGGPAPA